MPVIQIIHSFCLKWMIHFSQMIYPLCDMKSCEAGAWFHSPHCLHVPRVLTERQDQPAWKCLDQTLGPGLLVCPRAPGGFLVSTCWLFPAQQDADPPCGVTGPQPNVGFVAIDKALPWPLLELWLHKGRAHLCVTLSRREQREHFSMCQIFSSHCLRVILLV